MFILPLFTKSKFVTLLWGLFTLIVRYIFRNIGNGETAAIWCFSSILIAIPLSIYSDKLI